MPKHKSAKKGSFSRHSRDRRASRKHSSREKSRERVRGERHRRERSRDAHSSDSISSRDSSVRRSQSRESYGEIIRDFRDFLARRNSPHNLDLCQIRSPIEVIPPQDAGPASPLAAIRPGAVEQNTIEHTVAQADRGVVPGMSSC